MAEFKSWISIGFWKFTSSWFGYRDSLSKFLNSPHIRSTFDLALPVIVPMHVCHRLLICTLDLSRIRLQRTSFSVWVWSLKIVLKRWIVWEEKLLVVWFSFSNKHILYDSAGEIGMEFFYWKSQLQRIYYKFIVNGPKFSIFKFIFCHYFHYFLQHTEMHTSWTFGSSSIFEPSGKL